MNNNNKFQAREYNGLVIRQREDGFLDLTAIAQVGNFRLDNWWKQPSVSRYLLALAKKLNLALPSEKESKPLIQGNDGLTRLSASKAQKLFPKLVQVQRGGTSPGTFGHPLLGIRLAQEADEEFAVEVDFWVQEGFRSGQFQPQSKAGQALRILDNPRALLELLYGNDICKKLQKLYKNKFQIARFFWTYCYGFMTPEERAKHEQVNSLVNKRRNWRIYQFLDDTTVERLHPHVKTLYILIMAAHSKKQLESMLNEAYSQHNQMDLFDLWDFESSEAA